jgi:hypothetical protein
VSVGELASARTYSASKDNSDESRCSDGPALFSEGMDLLLEGWGMPAGAVGRDCKEGSEGLRGNLVLSRFEKKPRKEGAMGGSGEERGERDDMVVGEEGEEEDGVGRLPLDSSKPKLTPENTPTVFPARHRRPLTKMTALPVGNRGLCSTAHVVTINITPTN